MQNKKKYEPEPESSLSIEMIMEEFGTPIKRLIYSYVKDWEVASDLTQEVFITVYKKMDTFKGDSTLKTWIYRIAINKSKDFLKSWEYRNLAFYGKLFNLKKEKDRSPEAIFLQADESREIQKVIWSLPVKYREIVLLYYYQNLSFQEISETLNIPLSTVKTRLYRGQDKLKKILSTIRGDDNGQSS